MTGKDIGWEIIPTPRSDSVVSTRPDDAIPCLSKADLLFIKDLKREDKAKIAYLIQQMVRLEESNNELIEQKELLTNKYNRKCKMFSELEGYAEDIGKENENLKIENKRKDTVLRDYSAKLEETNALLKTSSDTHKRLQKKLNVKKRTVHVQTLPEIQDHKSQQTSMVVVEETAKSPPLRSPNTPTTEDPFKESLELFISKLDLICDKLQGSRNIEASPDNEEVVVHNHKTRDKHVTPRKFVEQFSNIRDSIMVTKKGKKSVKFKSELIDLIDELDNIESMDENEILTELFFNKSCS